MKKYVRVDTNNNAWGGGTTTLTGVINVNRTRNFGVAISNLQLQITHTAANYAAVETGDQIRVFHKDTSPVGNATADMFFKGFITKRTISDGMINLTCDDYLVKTQKKVGTVNYEDSSGTNIKTIIQALCTLAGLTYDMSATAMSPSTVLKFDTTNQPVFGRIAYLMGLVNWYWYFDPTLDDAVFRPKNAVTKQTFAFASSGKTTNITSLPEWIDDSGNVANDMIGVGGSSETIISAESHTYGESGWIDWASGNGDSYLLDEPYEDMTVTYVKIGSDAALSPGDFKTINGTDKTYLYFPSETQPTSGESFVVDYLFNKSSASQTKNNATSITQYGECEKVVNDRKIVDSGDLSDLLTNLVSDVFWGKATQEVRFTVNETTTTPILGSMADVYDGPRNKSLLWVAGTTECIVTTLSSSWPSGKDTITVSTKSIKDPFAASHMEDRYAGMARELSEIDPTKLFKLDGEKALTGALDLGGSQIINFRVHNVATNGMLGTTTAGSKGLLQFNTTSNKLFCYDGTTWQDIMSAGWSGSATSNLDMNDYDITECNTISATASQDLTFKVTSGRAIIWTTL